MLEIVSLITASTESANDELVRRLKEEREDLLAELRMWRQEAEAARVALDQLRQMLTDMTPRK
jgi:hypothetical protein